MIVNKARGKSGPLFHFDAHDDVRMRMDARVEKEDVRRRTRAAARGRARTPLGWDVTRWVGHAEPPGQDCGAAVV